MEKETIELRHLKASDGKCLTDGKVYVKEVYLAPSEDESLWHEADEIPEPQESKIDYLADEYRNTEPEE